MILVHLKQKIACILFVMLMVGGLPFSAPAAVPGRIVFQGYLTSPTGTPVDGAALPMVFKIYNDPTSVNPVNLLWTESGLAPVTVTKGIYSVTLGTPTVFPANMFDTNPNLYLEITVNSEVMTPRVKIESSAFSIKTGKADTAGDADTLDSMHASAFAASSHSHAAGDISTVNDTALSTNVVLRDNAQTITGVKAFNPSSGTEPFTVDATKTGQVNNLNAEMVGGKKLADLDSRYGPQTAPSLTGNNIVTTIEQGKNASLSIGFDGYPVLAYYSSGSVKVAKCADAACTSSTKTAIASVSAETVPVLILSNDGTPFVAFKNPADSKLKTVKCSDAACASSSTADVATNVTSVSAVLGIDGYPIISYGQGALNQLNLARCNNAACTTLTSRAVDITTNTGTYQSVSVDRNNYPHLSYAYNDATDLWVKWIKCGDRECTTSTTTTVTTSSPSGAGTTTVRDISSTTNYYQAPSIFVHTYNSDYAGDLTNIPQGMLTYFRCSVNSITGSPNPCTSTTLFGVIDPLTGVPLVGGMNNSIALTAESYPVVSYFESSRADIWMNRCLNVDCMSSATSGHRLISPESDAGQGATSVVVGTDNNPVIAYSSSAGDLKVMKCANQFCINDWRRR